MAGLIPPIPLTYYNCSQVVVNNGIDLFVLTDVELSTWACDEWPLPPRLLGPTLPCLVHSQAAGAD